MVIFSLQNSLTMPTQNHINYVEFTARDLESVKSFYSSVFDWEFTDYGPSYTAFSSSGIEGGFMKTEEPAKNGALIILYHDDLEAIKNKVLKADGRITQDIYEFPGGKRFHFSDPEGNELAVWSE